MVLDSSGRIVFANGEALHLLQAWETASGVRPSSRGLDPAVPPQILNGCAHLRKEWNESSPASPAKRANFAARLRIKHAQRSSLTAVIALERSRRDPRIVGFCVLMQDALKANVAEGQRDQLALLTQAERRVAKSVAEGLRNDEVARQLGRSIGTVKSHLRSVFGKLDVQSRTQLVTLLRSLAI